MPVPSRPVFKHHYPIWINTVRIETPQDFRQANIYDPIESPNSALKHISRQSKSDHQVTMKLTLTTLHSLLSLSTAASFCPSRPSTTAEQTDIFYQFVRKFYLTKTSRLPSPTTSTTTTPSTIPMPHLAGPKTVLVALRASLPPPISQSSMRGSTTTRDMSIFERMLTGVRRQLWWMC